MKDVKDFTEEEREAYNRGFYDGQDAGMRDLAEWNKELQNASKKYGISEFSRKFEEGAEWANAHKRFTFADVEKFHTLEGEWLRTNMELTLYDYLNKYWDK